MNLSGLNFNASSPQALGSRWIAHKFAKTGVLAGM